MKKRLRTILEYFRLSQKEFALKVGISQSAVSQLLSGSSKNLSADVIAAVSSVFSVNSNWLLTGQGEMFLTALTVQQAGCSQAKQVALTEDAVSARATRLVAALPAAQQKEAVEFLEYKVTKAGGDPSKIKEATAVYDAGQPATLPQTWDRAEDTVAVPVLGRIAAGVPMLAEENVEEFLEVPRRWLQRTGRFFGLRVRGVSMLGAGILDGDLAVMAACSFSPELALPEDKTGGTIVAVLINGEAALKRLRRDSRGFFLKSENPAYKPIRLSPEDENAVIGRCVVIIRKYYKD